MLSFSFVWRAQKTMFQQIRNFSYSARVVLGERIGFFFFAISNTISCFIIYILQIAGCKLTPFIHEIRMGHKYKYNHHYNTVRYIIFCLLQLPVAHPLVLTTLVRNAPLTPFAQTTSLDSFHFNRRTVVHGTIDVAALSSSAHGSTIHICS